MKFRILILKHHPDKTPKGVNLTEADKELINSAYLRIDSAYKNLLRCCNKNSDSAGGEKVEEPVKESQQKSSSSNSMKDMHLKTYLMQPHPAQVVSILRFFIDTKQSVGELPVFIKQFIQIGTGEGKSVTLAVTATILSLLGFDVDCACYSDYLSKRDYESFEDIFKSFEMERHISYGTFNQLAEKYINSGFPEGGIRTSVKQYIESSANKGLKEYERYLMASKPSMVGRIFNSLSNTIGQISHAAGLSPNVAPRHRILLIDEVDVFFKKDFYGNWYSPLVKISDPTITNLLKFIYVNKSDPRILRLHEMLKTEVYLACINKFPTWRDLIMESLKSMLSDIQTFDQHSYKVIRECIVYPDQDSVSSNKQYGYKTTFAYFKEHEKGLISKDQLDKQLFIIVNCGCFSYAEIPSQYYSILGVTGTLNTISNSEEKFLNRDIGINTFTYIPSVYGTNQLQFSGDSTKCVKIVTSNLEYYREIVNEIDIRLVGDLKTNR